MRTTEHLRGLTHLRIIFYYFVFAGADAAVDPDRSVPRDADLHPAAMRLIGALPSLQCVFLTACGIRNDTYPCKYWHSCRAWCVARADDSDNPCHGTPVCVEIPDHEARRVMEEEELCLGDSLSSEAVSGFCPCRD